MTSISTVLTYCNYNTISCDDKMKVKSRQPLKAFTWGLELFKCKNVNRDENLEEDEEHGQD